VKPCARCTTPAKCLVYGCCPGAWTAEVPQAPKTAAQRQAERKARELAAGRVQWKRWIHPDDVPALAACADRLARKRDRAARSSS
jgi:NAD(P)-dependent dehydrogenase (short-subunit alcohol dehydrogenase family)